MVAKKAKSKRGTARERYKVVKRVAEHRRQQRKESKNKKKGPSKPIKIPNNFPLKEELLVQAKMVRDAEKAKPLPKREDKVEEKPRKLQFDKSYLLTAEMIEECDCCLLVVDARDPMSGRLKELEQKCKNPIVILTKIDLIPRESLVSWYQELSKSAIVVPFSNKIGTEKSVELIGELTKDFEMVGVIGMPNSGKHNLLHCLTGLENIIKFPGLAFKKTEDETESFNVLLNNYSNSSKVPDPASVVGGLFNRLSMKDWNGIYKLAAVSSLSDFLMQQSRARNMVRRHGVLDITSAARSVIQDWYEQRISLYSMPKSTGEQTKSKASPSQALVKEIFELIPPKAEFQTPLYQLKSINYSSVDLDLNELPKWYKLHEDELTEDEMEEDAEDFEEIEEEEFEGIEEDDEDDEVEVEVEKPKSKPKKKGSTKGDRYDFSEHF